MKKEITSHNFIKTRGTTNITNPEININIKVNKLLENLVFYHVNWNFP